MGEPAFYRSPSDIFLMGGVMSHLKTVLHCCNTFWRQKFSNRLNITIPFAEVVSVNFAGLSQKPI